MYGALSSSGTQNFCGVLFNLRVSCIKNLLCQFNETNYSELIIIKNLYDCMLMYWFRFNEPTRNPLKSSDKVVMSTSKSIKALTITFMLKNGH